MKKDGGMECGMEESGRHRYIAVLIGVWRMEERGETGGVGVPGEKGEERGRKGKVGIKEKG